MGRTPGPHGSPWTRCSFEINRFPRDGPARGPAADQGARLAIYADVESLENYVALANLAAPQNTKALRFGANVPFFGRIHT